jgi:hypothetical protein
MLTGRVLSKRREMNLPDRPDERAWLPTQSLPKISISKHSFVFSEGFLLHAVCSKKMILLVDMYEVPVFQGWSMRMFL